MVNVLLAEYNVKPDQAVLVGDAESDVCMAKSAGIIPVAVLTGHLSHQQAVTLGVKYIISDVTHLEKVIKQISIDK